MARASTNYACTANAHGAIAHERPTLAQYRAYMDCAIKAWDRALALGFICC